MNLAALSKAVNVSHEFLAGYVFEHGLGQPVSEIQAAAALESDQLVKQAVAAREEEVSHFQKLGPLLQEKIQFFVKGDGATRVCHGQPSEPLSSVLELASGSYACHNGKCLDVGSSIEALGFFSGCTVRLYSRLRGSGPLDVLGQWQCGTCGAIRCWSTRNQCYKCGQPRSARSCSPRSSTYLDPQGMVGGLSQGFPSSSPLNPGMVHGPLGRLPPKRSQRGPTVSPKPPPGAGTGYVRFDEGPLVLPRSLLIRFSPLGLLLVVLPLSLLVRLLIQWRISFVLWSSLVPSWTPLRLRLFVLGWYLPYACPF